MSDLTNIASLQGEQTMTSREIAELTGKRHDHVMRDCRKLDKYYVENRRTQIWGGQYLAGNGEERPQFELTKRQCLDLCMGYSLALRIAVTDRWEELEKKESQPAIPQTYAEALRLAAETVEVNEALKLEVSAKSTKIEEDAPKVEIYNDLVSSDELISFSVGCKVLDIGLRNLYCFLRDSNVVSSKRGSSYNIPYQSFIDRGYFVVKTKPYKNTYTGKEGLDLTAYITGAGMIWLEKYLNKNY